MTVKPPLHVETFGNGPDLVLLHGWAMHGGFFNPVVNDLARYARVHVLDLPGHGRSRDWSDPYTLENVADSVLETLSPILRDKAIWLGWSLGGSVALHIVGRHPKVAEKLVLLASNPCFVQRPQWRYAIAEEVLTQFARQLEAHYEQTLLRFLSLQLRGADNVRDVLRQMREQLRSYPSPDKKVLKGGLNILKTFDGRDMLTSIDVPIHVIAGENDTLVPALAMQQLVRDNPKIMLNLWPGVGHAPFLSCPQAFVKSIREVVDELAA